MRLVGYWIRLWIQHFKAECLWWSIGLDIFLRVPEFHVSAFFVVSVSASSSQLKSCFRRNASDIITDEDIVSTIFNGH